MTQTYEATTTVPFAVPTELATVEAVDVTLGDVMETIDIGPFIVGPFVDVYYRASAPDLLVEIDRARRILNAAEDAVLEARQVRMDAQRRECPGCHTLLDEAEQTCGDARCERVYAEDGAL